MELHDAVRSIRRHWRMSVAIMLVAIAGLGVYFLSSGGVQPARQYRATAELQVPARSEKGERPEGVPASLLDGLRLAQSPETRKAVIAELQATDEEKREVSLGSGANEGRDIITLVATSPSSDLTAEALDRFVKAYSDARRETARQSLVSASDGARRQIAALKTRVDSVRTELDAADIDIEDTTANGEGRQVVVAPSDATPEVELLVAEYNTIAERIREASASFAANAADSLVPRSYTELVTQSQPRLLETDEMSPLIPVAGFLVGGLVLALGIPVARDRFDRSIRSAETATEAFDAPVFGAIPPARSERSLAEPGTARAAAYRSLATIIVATDQLPSVIMVTSPSGDSSDSVAANFAVALADIGLNVGLVPTKMEQAWFVPEQASGQVGEAPTFLHLLDHAHHGRLNGSLARSFLPTGIDNLRVVPPAPADQVARALDGLPPLLHVLANSDFDVTVIAGPPLLDDPNATIFAWAVRSVLWSVRAGEASEDEAREAARRLKLAGVAPFGVVLVDSDE